jgi:hypothetical protein
METFAGIPPEVDRRVRAGEHVLLVLIDAFGMAFVERHGEHPLLRGLDAVTPLASQFPSTTTAHVTTMHTGLPVGEHGLYEWNVYEPALGRVITPLRFVYAGTDEPLPLEPAALLPAAPTVYERLAQAGAPSFLFQPSAFSPSTFDAAAARGADLRPYEDLRTAVADAARALAGVDGGAYAYVYYDRVDTTGHLHGPSSPAFAEASLAALDAIEAGLRGASGLTVLLTADHGQVDVDPAATLWLDELHPPLGSLPLRPAGSARDVFLHVPEPDVEATVAALSAHVETVRVADLVAEGAFGTPISERLRHRLATVCVLPPPDRMAWLRSATDQQQRFRGHHGGRTPEESRTWLGELRRL